MHGATSSDFSVEIPGSLAAFVRSQVAAGVSESEAAFVHELIAREERRAKLTALLDVGFADEANGRVAEWNSDDVRAFGEAIIERKLGRAK
jgi:Arc/MetJ-type ribon-helix-helix transcriptional regulator